MDIDALISRLVDLNDKLADCVTQYAVDGRNDEADAVELRRRRLSTEIDRLAGLSHQQWRTKALSVRRKIEQQNREVAGELRQVEQYVKTVEDISRLLEHLDQLIRLAAIVAN